MVSTQVAVGATRGDPMTQQSTQNTESGKRRSEKGETELSGAERRGDKSEDRVAAGVGCKRRRGSRSESLCLCGQ